MSFTKPKEGGPDLTSTGGGTGKGGDAYLGKGSKVVGTLTFAGPVELDGLIEGEVIAQDRLVIGEQATITGKITGSDIVVRGTVNGDIIAHKKLSLKRPAKVIGNISSTNLSVEEGVLFDGKCVMNTATPHHDRPAPQDAKQEARPAR